MHKAQIVVLQLSETEETWWELSTYIREYGTGRLLLFTGAVAYDPERYSRIQRKARDELGLHIPDDPGYVVFIYFDGREGGKTLKLRFWPILLWPFLLLLR